MEDTQSSEMRGEEVSLSKHKTLWKLWGPCGSVRGRGDENKTKQASFSLLWHRWMKSSVKCRKEPFEAEELYKKKKEKKKRKGSADVVNVKAGWGITWSLKACDLGVTLNKNWILSLSWFKFYSGLPLLFGMKVNILNMAPSPSMILPAFLGSLT